MPNSERKKVTLTLTVDDLGGAGDALRFLFDEGVDPKREVQEMLAVFYGPLAIAGKESKTIPHDLTVVKAIHRLIAQIQLIQDRCAVRLVDFELRSFSPIGAFSDGEGLPMERSTLENSVSVTEDGSGSEGVSLLGSMF